MARFNIPPLTRTLLVLLIGLTILNTLLVPSSALSFFTRIGHGSPLLSLIPGESFKYPWTLLTASLVEQNIFGLIVNSLTLFFGGRYLERAWGLPEFAKFIVIICVIPNALCFFVYLAWHGASNSDGALYVCTTSSSCLSSDRSRTTTISGGIALQSAFLVAFKQLVPEHTVSVLRGTLRMRVKHFPAVFLLANTIAGVVLGTDTAMFLSWFAFLTSWVYLRFYRVSPLMTTATGGDVPTIKGDASDTFAFAYFFPEPIHTPISKVADQIYNALVALRVCTPFSAEDIDVGNEQATARAEGGLPLSIAARGSGRREEAERRRALALKALDQRLHAATGKPPAAASIITIPVPTVAPESSESQDQSNPS
jgi:membrane associated rhomboid family serine protease